MKSLIMEVLVSLNCGTDDRMGKGLMHQEKQVQCLIPMLPFWISPGQGGKGEEKRLEREAVYFQLPFMSDHYMSNAMRGPLQTYPISSSW